MKWSARLRDTQVASSRLLDVLRVATDGGARELLRVVLGEARALPEACAVVSRCGRRRSRFTLSGLRGCEEMVCVKGCVFWVVWLVEWMHTKDLGSIIVGWGI